MNAAEIIADLLSRGHSVRFRATGHSMHPIIRCDDYLLVSPLKSIHIGDVVLTLAERGLTAHRVISVANGVVITRGDNAPGEDEPLALSRVLGVVTHAERDGKLRRVRSESSLALRVHRLWRRALIHFSAHAHF
jgi:SOS-response transcriptional repressor LexA